MINTLSKTAIALLFGLCSLAASAQNHPYPGNGDDTILIEKEPSTKIPYSKIMRAVSKRLFDFDSDKVTSFGQNKKSDVVRFFSDYSDRAKYRFKVDRDEIEFKLSINL